ncbi:MAG: hypothetical protein HYZ39_10245 [Mycolicibacterium cosmeticum]|nr:hypothetical protein [Mycolicibacterium cosmeticum]
MSVAGNEPTMFPALRFRSLVATLIWEAAAHPVNALASWPALFNDPIQRRIVVLLVRFDREPATLTRNKRTPIGILLSARVSRRAINVADPAKRIPVLAFWRLRTAIFGIATPR